ncbi:phage tail tip fiber protein [Pseudomonas sp. RP23018S]|uniref:phage tail tip fiber protein n=1 Tax=Pseudomonas sp. RP23018S TaxID=3096037 RepID=UPI003A101740
MVEQVVGDGTVPSTFVPGNTADQTSAAASAVESLNSAVTQQGKDLTSVTGRTTLLENSVNSTSSGLATKASTSALQTLTGRVTATESGLTAANSSITRIGSQVGAIGGTGSNLIPAEYSTFTDTLPAFRAQGGLGITAQADSTAYSGSLLKVDSSSGSGWMWLAASPSDYNLRLVAGRQYIVSFWAKGSTAHIVAVRLRYQNTAGGETEIAAANVNVATDMARLSLTFTAPAALVGPACIVLFTQSAANAGITWFDGFMVEEKIGEATAPSAFTPGTSTRQAAGQALAVAALDTKVTQQGAKIESEAKRTDGLYTSVGNANAAIQSEASARSDGDTALGRRIDTVQSSVGSANASIQSEAQTRASADTALGRRVDTVQSNLGNTNASVQQVATAQANLKGELNAQYSVRVQVNHQGGYYHFGGFGIGVTEQGGVVQSAFVVYADQFILINGNSGGLSSPWSVVGGQTFIADAYIRDASIGTAKIADAAITAAKIGVAEVDTLRIRGNAVTVPTTYTVPDSSAGAGTGAWMDLVAIQVTMDQPGMIQVQFSCAQDYTNAQYFFRSLFEVYINGTRIATAGGSAVSTSPVLVGAIGVGAGTFIIKARWWAENSTIVVRDKVLFAMGCKR